jgi:dihydroorotate dehydrogenase electron transfer subunit
MIEPTPTERPRPTQVRGEVLTNRRTGDYHVLTLVAPAIAAIALPGQFVALAVGGNPTSTLLRRALSIHQVSERGVYGGTVDVVVAAHGPGTRWLVERRPHDTVDVVGPLGRPFGLPQVPVSVALVGGGYGSAPLFPVGEKLRSLGCRVHFILGAATQSRLFGVLEAKRMAHRVAVTTEDGSAGVRGRVTDALPDMMRQGAVDRVFACGPMGMLRAVSELATAHGATSQCAVEETMACGIGVCMTCVLPVVGVDGSTRMVRSCVDGPVFDGAAVRWGDIGSIPADAVGAPAASAVPR